MNPHTLYLSLGCRNDRRTVVALLTAEAIHDAATDSFLAECAAGSCMAQVRVTAGSALYALASLESWIPPASSCAREQAATALRMSIIVRVWRASLAVVGGLGWRQRHGQTH
jgi:hypothetical protein